MTGNNARRHDRKDPTAMKIAFNFSLKMETGGPAQAGPARVLVGFMGCLTTLLPLIHLFK
ncbi:hypothetical protein [Caulobacter sp. SSI4214]|uniref:hypothetical protein n=1 Tax=Caulobacter sp. SSI4214 TaxID=2575739 RepID=UPI00143956D2|nr:hypothetical protein [Caulobacter sp. SSI4214]